MGESEISSIKEAAAYLRGRFKYEPDLGIILGSGLGDISSDMEKAESLEYREIPHFPKPSVKGHSGLLLAGKIGPEKVLVFSGRAHYYEGFSMQEVAFPVWVMAELGMKKLIITNAAGAVTDKLCPGNIVLIRDHINLMGDTPLRGRADFVDMTSAYSRDMILTAESAGKNLGIELYRGVYVANAGPSYETPAEVRMAGILGGDVVGMSTVPEVIAAKSRGMDVLGISLVTNMAAGLEPEGLSHEKVISAASDSQEAMRKLIVEIIGMLTR